MSTRVKPILETTFHLPGPRYEQTHQAWGGIHTAKEMSAASTSLDENTKAEDIPILSYFNILALVSTADESDAVNGFRVSASDIEVPGLMYLDDPVDAFALNLQLAATQTDLRYWVPVGQHLDGWLDKIEFPTGGWPTMIQTKGALPEGVTKPDRDTVYDGTSIGLVSRFMLPANPQFALGLWILPNIRLQGMVPMTNIRFGYDGTQEFNLTIGGDNNPRMYWRHMTYTGNQHVRLTAVREASIKPNTWSSPGREGRHIVLEVWCVGHGIAVTTDRFQSMSYFRLPHGEPVDGLPYGKAIDVPQSSLGIANNTGQFGVQFFEYRAPSGGLTNSLNPWIASGAIRAPYDPTGARDDLENGADGYPPIEFLYKYLCTPSGGGDSWTQTAGLVNMTYLLNGGWPAGVTGPLPLLNPGALRTDELQWVAFLKPSIYTYEFTPSLGSYIAANLRNASDDPVVLTTHQTPLLWSVAYGQKATVSENELPGVDTSLSEQDIVDLRYGPGEGDADPSGTIQVDNKRGAFDSRLATRSVTRVQSRAGWDDPAGNRVDNNAAFEGELSLWKTDQGGSVAPSVSAEIRTILSQLDDQRITGSLMGGEGQLVSTYIGRVLEAFGLHHNQYLRVIESEEGDPVVYSDTTGVEVLEPTGELIDVARLNVGPPENPLWTPEASRGIRQLLEDILLYSYGAGMWLVPYDWGGEVGVESIVTTGCPYCHRHRVNTPGDTHYPGNHLGPRSAGCLAYDATRTAAYGDGRTVDYPLYTRAERSTLAVGENLGYEVLSLEREPIDIREKYYNHLIVKGPSVRLGKSRDQVSVEWTDPESIKGTTGYEFALGYKRTAPVFQRDWITSYGIANRVGWCLVAQYQSIGDIVNVTVPLLSAARAGHTFSIAGGEDQCVDGWICRIIETPWHVSPTAKGINRGTTTLRGVKIGEVA